MNHTVSLLSAGNMRRSILAGLFTATGVVCGIAPFFYIVTILDLLARRSPFTAILPYCALVATFLIGKSVFYGLGLAFSHRVAFAALADIRSRIIAHMECLSLADIAKHKSGAWAQIVNHEVEQVELFLAHALPELLVASIIPVAILIFVYTVYWRFALILFIQIPLLGLYMIWYMKRYASTFNEVTERTSRMSEDLLEYIAGIRVIKAFNTGKGKTCQLLARMRDYITWVKQVSDSITGPKFIRNCIINGGVFSVAVVGIQQLFEGNIDYKAFVIGIIFASFFGESLGKLLDYTFKVMQFNASRKAIISVLAIPSRRIEGTGADVIPGDIEFSGVSFAYGDVPVIEDISFIARQHTTIVLVGVSGSGKTTIGKLINGFLLPDTGAVFINGVSIRDLPEQAISRLVSYVQQEAFLFNTSVYENILIGNPEATKTDVYKAARQAQIHDFIQSLPDGYQTQVGEAGARLSGGERQRISLARMILKDAPIIVLDEATASLDPQNEQAIGQAIEAVSAGKTRVVITHRLDSIHNADQIIVLDNGRIIDQGLHTELLSRCRLYKQMVDARYAVEHWTIKEGPAC